MRTIFNDDIVAFIPTRHLEKEDGSKLGKGDEAVFKIIEFNKEFKRVVASHTVLFKEQEVKNLKRASKNVAASNSEKATLGDLITSSEVYCSSNSTRGIFFHSEGTISYITLSSFGNSVDFGDCTVSRFNASSCSSSTRGVFSGGQTPSATVNTIEYVTILTTGNAIDFGDLQALQESPASLSNAHGGL